MNTIKPIFLFVRNSLAISTKKICFSVVIVLFVFAKAFAQPANIVVNPASTIQTVGASFTVQVALDFTGATPPLGVDAIGIYLAFDNTKLQVTAMSELPPVSGFTSKPIPLEATPFTTTNTNGQVSYAASTTSGFPTTDINVLSITFQVIGGVGTTTPLTLRRDFPFDFTDAFRNGFSIVTAVTSSSVTITAAGCGTPPTGTLGVQAGPATCDANPFNLVLATAANGTGPFDVNVTTPSGTATFNNIAVGGTITNFAPPSDRVWPAVPFPLPATFTDNSYTLGVRFSTSVTGFVKGVRFLSADAVSAVPGNYTGQLWSNTGTLLASGVFGGVTADSWQEILFTEPILITAGTPYVASYNMGISTDYASTPNGLVAPVTSPTLGTVTALAGGGLFIVGTPVAFPTNATNNNYWADVIFAPNVYGFTLNSIVDDLGCVNNPGPPIHTLNVTSIDCSTLPVSLINFSATPKDNAVLLRWATASEFNNLGFEVQRSIDGNNGWSAIGFVNGAGNSNSLVNYSYVDENLSASRYYYRLKQIDIDQRFAYSPIVSAQLDGKQSFDLQQNYPNPFRGETIIRFTLPQKTNINLSIFDMNGRLVKVLASGSKDSGTHAVTLNSGILTSGLYYYKLQAGDFSAVKKLTIR